MDFLRSKGLPIPKVYAYSFMSNNEAETEYILMEYVEGTDLSQIWSCLKEDEIVSFMDQLAKIESTMMSIFFPRRREHLLRQRPEGAVWERGHPTRRAG